MQAQTCGVHRAPPLIRNHLGFVETTCCFGGNACRFGFEGEGGMTGEGGGGHESHRWRRALPIAASATTVVKDGARVYFGLFSGGHLERMRRRGSRGFGGGARSLCGGDSKDMW